MATESSHSDRPMGVPTDTARTPDVNVSAAERLQLAKQTQNQQKCVFSRLQQLLDLEVPELLTEDMTLI